MNLENISKNPLKARQNGILLLGEICKAPQHGSARCLQLIAAGANTNMRGDLDRTALMYAARNGLTEIIDALIAQGARINAQDYSGMTPLMHAAENGHTKAALALIAHGADTTIKSNQEMTAQEIADILDRTSLRKALVEQLFTTAAAKGTPCARKIRRRKIGATP